MGAGPVIIAGGGLAGFQTAASLREMGYDGRIVLVADEASPPYHRPPLSKAYLLGTTDATRLLMRPTTFYSDKKIEVHLGRRVVALDRTHHRAAFDDDTTLEYSHFVFAVGARNRPLPVPGADLAGVHFLRTLDEARELRAELSQIKRAVVIGAGFIGLEFAMAARKWGVDVTVIDVVDRPMARALSPQMSAIFTREHQKSGVHFLFNTQVMRVLGESGRVTGVETVEGAVVPGELVLVGIGIQPNVEVAAACDLEIRNGILVNEQLATADPNVSAVGDCAAHPNPFASGAITRLESVQNATDQARCVASRITGKPQVYANVPWFWSDQGDLKLQIAGLTTGFDKAVVRGDAESTSCAIYCFRGERLLGVETVNRPGEHMTARRLVGRGITVTPAQAADERFDLKQLLSDAA